MIVVDAHEDIAFNALCFNRDYRYNAWVTRRMESANADIARHAGGATLGLPDAILGRVGVVFATIFTAPWRESKDSEPWDNMKYKTPQEAYSLGSKQMDYYHRLADETDKIMLILTEADLDEALASWADETDIKDHRQGMVILMEGADPIIEPKQFEEWYERGVRIVGTSWKSTRYAGGTGEPGGLTDLGRELLDVMADFNALLDLSHMAAQACQESLDRYAGPLFASHSNPRRFCDTDRHLTDETIRRLAERDGVMGIVLYNRFLSNIWKRGDPRSDVPLATVVAAIDYVCQLTGSAAHVGIGSDFDGGFGVESVPEGLDTVSDLWEIGKSLRARGYSEKDIEAVLGGNMLRKLRQSLVGAK